MASQAATPQTPAPQARRTAIAAGPGPNGNVRKMTDEEFRSWTRAIHRACSPDWVPALRFAFANLMPFVDEDCSTAYTDCHYRVGLSPDMLDPEQTTDEQLAIVVLHETLHNVQKHAQRFEGLDVPPLVRNYVTDFEINSIIASGICNIDLNAPIIANNPNIHWDWLLGEVISVETKEQADELNEQFGNKKHPIAVGDKTYRGILLPRMGAFWDIPPGLTAEQYLSLVDYDLTGGGVQIFQRHTDGSETTLAHDGDWVDRVESDAELDAWNPVDELGIHPMERGLENEVRDRLAHDIDEYRRTAGAGDSPMQAVLNYVGRALRPPVVDWNKILRQVSRKAAQEMTAGRQDYTYRKRRRRSGGEVTGMPHPVEVIYPGQAAYTPSIRLAIDTSGSMSRNEYFKVLSEAAGIIREFSTDIEIVCVDARAGSIFKARSVEEIAARLTGGGGTDMSVPLRQVINEKPKDRPDVLIIASDGVFRWQRFLEALSSKELQKTAVILLCVYKFDDSRYYLNQESIAEQARQMRAHKRNAYLVQAWVD